jgi:ariadne-1
VNDAKFELQRYMFYFERYNNHEKSQKHAKMLVPVVQKKVTLLHQLKQYPQIELDFLPTAIHEIVKCRQVLKFTYTFGYYTKMEKQQKNLFEH